MGPLQTRNRRIIDASKRQHARKQTVLVPELVFQCGDHVNDDEDLREFSEKTVSFFRPLSDVWHEGQTEQIEEHYICVCTTMFQRVRSKRKHTE